MDKNVTDIGYYKSLVNIMLGRSLLSCTHLHKKHTNMDKNVTDIGYYKSLVFPCNDLIMFSVKARQ
jgi:hypothetical protein